MRHVLVHDYYQIDTKEVWKVINKDLRQLRQQVARYLSDTNWEEWEKNEDAFVETSVHKSLIKTALRMKQDGHLVIRILGNHVAHLEHVHLLVIVVVDGVARTVTVTEIVVILHAYACCFHN